MTRTAIVLAGHGSHISSKAAGVVWEAVDALRRTNAAHEVTAAFWKEQPSFATVLDSLDADDITIVPLFTAQGYFTRTVLPAEMTLDAHMSKTIRYAQTVGEHPHIAQIIRQRVDTAVAAASVPPDQIAVAVIGHGDPHSPDSRKATEAQTMLLRATTPVREVIAVYLDGMPPAISDVYHLTTAPYLIAVPFFVAAGSDTLLDVPRALGLGDDGDELGVQAGKVGGRVVIYTPPLGTPAELASMALDLARTAGSPLNTMYPTSSWSAFPAAGFELSHGLMSAVPSRFGQLLITSDDVRHIDDAERGDLETLTDPTLIRRRMRETPFRPLSTADDLPGGWRIAVEGNAPRLHTVIETIYPGVLGSTHALGRREIAANAFALTIERQTGRYRSLADMEPAACAEVVAEICGRCVQVPLWAGGRPSSTEAGRRPCCPEPCNVWLSAAMQMHKD